MKKLVMGVVVLMAAATAFSQGSTKNQLDNCVVELGDAKTNVRNLTEENKKLKAEIAPLKTERDRAVADKDKALAEAEKCKTINRDLQAKNKELTDNAAQLEANSGTLQTLANENNRLATENMNLRNQLAAQANTVPAAAPDKFLYPISGVLGNKSVNNNVIVADLIFTNNGSKRINSFDSVLKFYYQGRKIYEISLPGVKNPAGSAFGRNESINFRAGLPVTDQNLVNAPVDAIDLIVEITNIQ